jgi:hypothetical protein
VKVDKISTEEKLSSREKPELNSAPVISKRNSGDGTHKIEHLNTKGKKCFYPGFASLSFW